MRKQHITGIVWFYVYLKKYILHMQINYVNNKINKYLHFYRNPVSNF